MGQSNTYTPAAYETPGFDRPIFEGETGRILSGTEPHDLGARVNPLWQRPCARREQECLVGTGTSRLVRREAPRTH